MASTQKELIEQLDGHACGCHGIKTIPSALTSIGPQTNYTSRIQTQVPMNDSSMQIFILANLLTFALKMVVCQCMTKISVTVMYELQLGR